MSVVLNENRLTPFLFTFQELFSPTAHLITQNQQSNKLYLPENFWSSLGCADTALD